MELLDAVYSTVGTTTTHHWHYCRRCCAHYQTLPGLVAKEFIMKDKVSVPRKIFMIEIFMRQAQELANDPTAGQPNLDGEALWTAVGQTNRNTLDAFIKQGLMPNSQGKRWTKRQAHLFSGLCAIEECYDTWIMMLQENLRPVKPQYNNHIRDLRANLLIWTWVMYSEQYGITPYHVREVMRHWAAHAAKLPLATISYDKYDIAGWNISQKSEAVRHTKAALQGIREKRQRARAQSKSLPLPLADYEEYYRPILSGLVDAIQSGKDEREKKRKLDAGEKYYRSILSGLVDAGYELEELAGLLTVFEYTLDCLQSHRVTFDDDIWYRARDFVRRLWESESSSQEQTERFLSTIWTLIEYLTFIAYPGLLEPLGLRAEIVGRSKQRGTVIKPGSWLSIYPAYRNK